MDLSSICHHSVPTFGRKSHLPSTGATNMLKPSDELARRRLEIQIRELMVHLRETKGVVRGTDYVEDVAEYRKAARIAGRRLGIVVRTGVSRDGTKVWVSEGP
jgi:hypothetical protein